MKPHNPSTTYPPLLQHLQATTNLFPSSRLPSLYSELNPSTNPDNYLANISTWKQGLSSAALDGALPGKGSRFVIDVGEELYKGLETRGLGRPSCLGVVGGEAVKDGGWWREGEFRRKEGSVFVKVEWSISPLGIIGWGLRTLGVLGSGVGEVKGKLVVLGNLERVGEEVMGRWEGMPKGRVERIFSRKEFADRFRDVVEGDKLRDGDLELLLLFLRRDKGVLAYDPKTGTVKFFQPGEKTGSITHEDETIAGLKDLIKELTQSTNVLEKKVDELALTAKDAVAKNNRVAALAALRSKKLAESTLTKRHATLAQLEEVFNKIEQAADQVDLVRIMEGSAEVLKGLNKEVGGVERVEDVAEKLREQMGAVGEVGNIIAEVGKDGVAAIDEGEVDDELEAMINEEKEASERVERKEREQKEAEETRRRLNELAEMERKVKADAKAKANAEKDKEEKSTNDELMNNIGRLSLEA